MCSNRGDGTVPKGQTKDLLVSEAKVQYAWQTFPFYEGWNKNFPLSSLYMELAKVRLKTRGKNLTGKVPAAN